MVGIRTKNLKIYQKIIKMNRHREILDTTKCTNISIMGLSEGEAIE